MPTDLLWYTDPRILRLGLEWVIGPLDEPRAHAGVHLLRGAHPARAPAGSAPW
ncbi:hypothetical protein ACWCPM_06020 [Streptomyces sp. NPDC002309]